MSDILLTEFKTWQSSLDSRFTKLSEQVASVQKQADAIDQRMQRSVFEGGQKGLDAVLRESAALNSLLESKQGRARIELTGHALTEMLGIKTVTVGGLGTATPGVFQYDLDRGITPMARPALRMRDVLASRPTNMARVAWLKETVRPTKASPIGEASEKPSTDLTISVDYEDVKKIALLCTTSDEVLADSSEVSGFIRGELSARVLEELDTQILYGDGSGNNLNGLTTQAQAFDSTLLDPDAAAGYSRIDCISAAVEQILAANELAPSFVAMHVSDWQRILRLKDGEKRFLFGSPASATAPRIWSLNVVPSTQITSGYFLVGSGDPRAAELRDRMGLTIDVSTETSNNFRDNLATFRCELRAALVVKRPEAFVYGAFVSSPA